MTAASPTQSDDREEGRVELHVSAERRRLLDDAAAVAGMSVGAFVVILATDAARDLLGDASIVPSEQRWRAFVAMLDDACPP
jgi:uncharacterized protein (DUF1778 family)